MRYKMKSPAREQYFNEIKNVSGSSWTAIAKEAKISSRNLLDWRKGAILIPDSFVDHVQKTYAIRLPKHAEQLDEFWSKSSVGKLGGVARNAMHGNPGTPEGRRKGGLTSMATHTREGTRFFERKPITLPPHSEKLAEFIGIVLGDGGITERQVCITVHRFDDKEYCGYIADLCKELFKTRPYVVDKPQKGVRCIVLSSTTLVDFLGSMGIPPGNKVANQVTVPAWIRAERHYALACTRGLFDTDGCIYVDTHKYKTTIYKHCCLGFSNRSLPLLSFFKKTLTDVGLHPTQRTKYVIFLRRGEEIVRYFEAIGSSNPKHMLKFSAFQKSKEGRVPKRS